MFLAVGAGGGMEDTAPHEYVTGTGAMARRVRVASELSNAGVRHVLQACAGRE
jgi:hypothetical protein